MPEYKALRTLYGDMGHVNPGQVFTVPGDTTSVRRMDELAAKGLVMRHRPAVDRKAYTAYSNKSIATTENKSVPSGTAITPPLRTNR